MEFSYSEKNFSWANTSTIRWVGLYALLIIVAETVVAFVDPILGTALDAALLFALLNSFIFRKKAEGRIYLVLALLPLLRIFSLVVPVIQLPQIYWYAMAGIPVLLAVVLATPWVEPRWMGMHLNFGGWVIQFLIALIGLPLAIAAYWISRPGPLVSQLNWQEILIGSLILIVFSGFLEELIFRSLVLPAMEMAFGRFGLLLSSILYAGMFLGTRSIYFVLFMGLVGLLFGYVVKRSGSIWGVVIAHSILSIGLIWILPVLW